MEVINRVGLFTIALLNNPNISVKRARSNHKNTNFKAPLILVDNLASAQKIGSSDKYNGSSEVLSYGDYYKQVFTFDIYGTNAYTNAQLLSGLLRSQRSSELQRANGLTVYRPSSINNLKILVGTQYNERYQIEVMIGYWDSIDVGTLRIDTVEPNLTLIEQ